MTAPLTRANLITLARAPNHDKLPAPLLSRAQPNPSSPNPPPQIAKALGAHVTATCGPSNTGLVTGTLGADVAVDYTKEAFDDVSPGPYDIIVDLVGGDYEPRGMKLLKKRGRVRGGAKTVTADRSIFCV